MVSSMITTLPLNKKSFHYSVLKVALFALFFWMLSHPSITYTKVSNALVMWFNTLVPTLLPVLIISNLIVMTRAWELLIPILHPILGRLFYISPSGSFAILLGVLCGYPIGAKVVSDLYKKKEITKEEAKRLLTFVTFPSPMFLKGFVLEQCLGKMLNTNHFDTISESPITSNSYIIPICVSIYGSAIIIGIFHALYARKKAKHCLNLTYMQNNPIANDTTVSPTFATFQQTLLSSAEIILFVGLYMMLATILAGFLECYLDTPFLPLLAGMLEMTTGITLLSISNFSLQIRSIIAVFLCCFGGLSIALQTSIVLPKEKGWFRHYLVWKIIHGIVAVLLLIVIDSL